LKIEVLFFAQLREAVGDSMRVLEVGGTPVVSDVIAVIEKWPEWRAVSSLPLTFAVNERVVDAGHQLGDGDRLALLTPIQGG
jgi:molybdopterin converting factor small subunit